MKKVGGVFLLLIAAVFLAWISYNLFVERLPATKGRSPIGALIFVAGCIFIGIKWIRERKATVNFKELDAELLSVLDELKGKLPKDREEDIRDLFLHTEYGVGLEVLCSNLHDYYIKISPEIYERLKRTGESMQMKDSTWICLKELIITEADKEKEKKLILQEKPKNREEYGIKLGKLKNLEEITLDDMYQNPIWVNDLSGENDEESDETSERPLIGATDVTKQVLKEFVSVSIFIKVVGSNMYGSAHYDEDGNLSAMSFWSDKSWQSPSAIFPKGEKVIVEAIPSIEGEKNCRFILNIDKDIATKINS